MSISEFARLRDVDINSLRYYDKLGILKPAHVDPDSGYRYYAPEQLSQLDIVILALSVGMPLKELNRYLSDGSIDARRFMEQGQTLLEAKFNDLQMRLNNIRHTLNEMDVLHEYEQTAGLYARQIPERRIIVSDVLPDRLMEHVEPIGIELFEQAQRQNMMPVLPSGFLIRSCRDRESCRLFFEIMNFKIKAPNVLTIPAGEYVCVHEEVSKEMPLFEVVRRSFGPGDLTVFVCNLFTSKLTFCKKHLELQKIPNSVMPDLPFEGQEKSPRAAGKSKRTANSGEQNAAKRRSRMP